MARSSNRPAGSRKLRERAITPEEPSNRFGPYLIYGVITAFVLLSILAFGVVWQSSQPEVSQRQRRRSQVDKEVASQAAQSPMERQTRFFERDQLTLVWDRIKPHVRPQLKPTSATSNIAPADYAGPEACADCHKENYADWSKHPHRWMNAEASRESVMGDFSGEATLNYRGGLATFFHDGQDYRMRFERDDVQREYRITQTIGSRFYQYYVGLGVEGPEPEDHDYYHKDFVLPFGFWLDRKAWVPIVHIFQENPDGERWESIETLRPTKTTQSDIEQVGRARGVVDHSQDLGLIYSSGCNFCHTTFALGEMMIRNPKVIGPSLPTEAMLEMSEYVASVHPEMWDGSNVPELLPEEDLNSLIQDFFQMDARQHAETLGVSCEACHLGCKRHAEDETQKPAFASQHPNLLIYHESKHDIAKSAANLNAICARCHAGNRPTYAAGMATWNSTEHTDAMRGHCYSELTCIHCHDPHRATGKVWTKTPEQDDASCLTCHSQYEEPDVRQLHTRHPAGSSGDRCMNCHMPKINEGMQDVVRTHTIFSPTNARMIEANQPNACNLCHLEKSINWTLGYLREWYGRLYNDAEISRNYVDRNQSVGLGWLQGTHHATRLVAVEAFGEQHATWGLSSAIDLLDDPYLLNRQFAQTAVEALTGRLLDQEFGYWYYMMPQERKPLIDKLRLELSMPGK